MKYGLSFLLICLTSFSAQAEKCDFIQFNKCMSCDSRYAFDVGSVEACSFLCPRRVTNFFGSGSGALNINCALEKCPADFPFQSKYGSCFATAQEADADFGDALEENINNENILNDEKSVEPLDQNKNCPPDFPLFYYNKCFSCDEVGDLSVSKEDCAFCSNRTYYVYPNWGAAYCELPCPPDKPLKRWDGQCFPCDFPQVIRVPTHCNLERDCEDICPNRTLLYDIGGNIPSVPNCPPDKPLMDNTGICYACDTPVDIGLPFDNTKICERFCATQRHVNGYFCVLNETAKNE